MLKTGNQKKTSILITGASGFVGKNLIAYLTKLEFSPVPITSVNTINVYQNELLKANAVVHLAGKAHDLKATSNPREYYDVNFELTKNLFDSFLRSEANKFIFVSSVKACADVVDGILKEEDIPNPITDYGKSKLMAEQYIQAQEIPEGKSYYILRPCMIHGPGNKGNLNLLYQFVRKGIPYPLGSFNNQRSFLSIENLCFIITKLLEKDVLSGIYNVADDESLSTNDLIGILSQSLNKKPKLWNVPKSFMFAFAKLGDKLNLPFNTEKLNKLTENYIVSNKKIKEAINLDLPIKTKEGLLVTANSFKR